jgi:2-polyprenyl-6-methoxyphenol hydroxylase-like FAD-dependent oxidoreductase
VRYECRAKELLWEGPPGARRVVGAVLAKDGVEQPVRARLVVGADGSSSSVREKLGLSVVHTPYDHGFYIIEIERPPAYEDAMRIDLHPDGGVLIVPQGAKRVGLGVLVRKCDEELFRAGPLAKKAEAIGRRSALLSGMQPLAKGAHLYSLYRGHAPRYLGGGAVLIGDAIHVTNPTAGQGMTMAIEDAEALSRRVAPALAAGASGPAIDAALLSYERERWPKNDAQIRWSHWMSRFYALSGPLGEELQRRVFRVGASPLGQRIQRFLWTRMAHRKTHAEDEAQRAESLGKRSIA